MAFSATEAEIRPSLLDPLAESVIVYFQYSGLIEL
jgi:hypothetical protein